MKRKKRQLTSKALTLRLAAVALVMALLACLLGFYTPLPSQVINQTEKNFSTEPLGLLERHWFGASTAYLLGNENSLHLLFCRYYLPFGWGSDGSTTIDLSKAEGPVWASTALYNGNRNIKDNASYDIHQFGRVDVEGAQSVRILFPSWPGRAPVVLPLFQGEDGLWYFWNWLTIQWNNNEHSDFFDIDVEVLDAAGTVLYTYETTLSYTEEELAG